MSVLFLELLINFCIVWLIVNLLTYFCKRNFRSSLKIRKSRVDQEFCKHTFKKRNFRSSLRIRKLRVDRESCKHTFKKRNFRSSLRIRKLRIDRESCKHTFKKKETSVLRWGFASQELSVISHLKKRNMSFTFLKTFSILTYYFFLTWFISFVCLIFGITDQFLHCLTYRELTDLFL